MRLALLLIAGIAAASAGPAHGSTQRSRDAPWRLTAITKDQRTLKVVYEGSGCLLKDGKPVVDTSAAGAVRIRVVQTEVVPTGPYEACTLPLAFVPLDVSLGARLAGRRVLGGPRFAAQRHPDVVPRVIGLRRADAMRALRGQQLRVSARGRRTGVVRLQTPRPGTRIALGKPAPRVSLYVGRSAMAARPFRSSPQLRQRPPDSVHASPSAAAEGAPE